MRSLSISLLGTVVLAAFLALPMPLNAQNTREDPTAELESLLSKRAVDNTSSRDAVLEFLEGNHVREIASGSGIDLEKIRAGVQTLEADRLAGLENDIQQMDEFMAGGDRIVIASSTVIIILLIIILVAVA